MGDGSIINEDNMVNGTNDVVYHSNIEDGYIAFWKQEFK